MATFSVEITFIPRAIQMALDTAAASAAFCILILRATWRPVLATVDGKDDQHENGHGKEPHDLAILIRMQALKCSLEFHHPGAIASPSLRNV